MYNESDQMTEFSKSTLDTALQLSQIALNSTEKLVGLQWVSTRQSLADAHSVLQPETDLWDLPTLLGLRAKLTEKSVENAATYLRNIYEVAAYTKDQIADLFTLQWREWSKNINSQLPLMVYGSARMERTQPAGAEVQLQMSTEVSEQSGVSVPLIVPPEEVVTTSVAAEAPVEAGADGIAQAVAEAPVQAEVIVAIQTIPEAPVQAEAVALMVQEAELPTTIHEPVRVAETPARARKATITASDFSAAFSKPVSAANRASKTAKPTVEKSKPAVAKKKTTAKR